MYIYNIHIYDYLCIHIYMYVCIHASLGIFIIPHIIGLFHISIAHVRCLGRKHHRVGKPPLLM